MRYFITFACYGAHLHGDQAGSADPHHNPLGSPLLAPNPKRASAELRSLKQAPDLLDRDRRAAVLDAIRETCLHRRWSLLAAHVRTTHVHVIVDAGIPPETVMNDLKAYAARALNSLEGSASARKRWARHGSTRWLWKDQDVQQAIRYVVENQGEPMAVFIAAPAP